MKAPGCYALLRQVGWVALGVTAGLALGRCTVGPPEEGPVPPHPIKQPPLRDPLQESAKDRASARPSPAFPSGEYRLHWDAPRLLGVLQVSETAETSGLCAGRLREDLLYTHDDSGGEPVLRAFDRRGRLHAEVRLVGALNLDWEDIACGPGPEGRSTLYVGDIGDNLKLRPAIAIYRIPEPELPCSPVPLRIDVKPEVFTLEYPDGPHDAEALLVHPWTGMVYIVTKSERGAALYHAPLVPGRRGELRRLQVLHLPPGRGSARVTAGDFYPDGRYVALRARHYAVEYRVVSRTPPLLELSDPVVVPLSGLAAGEALGYRAGGLALLVTIEGPRAPLHEIPSLEALLLELAGRR
ncbi:MAG: hypothetical protein AB1486_04205 [Planctomycetota bacterium]